MKTLLTLSLTTMAFSLSGCASPLVKTNSYQGRIIEYKSDANGFDTRTFFYEGEHEVIAFDSQFTPELAQRSIDHLRTLTQKPISWLVLTHPNPDKFNGASVFKNQGTKIISSAKTAAAIPEGHAYKEYYFVEMAKMFKKGTYPQPVAVDQTFEQSIDLVLKGGERIQLQELSQPGVSTNQTVAYVSSQNALFVGDLIHNQAHAWLEGGIVAGQPTPTISGWIADLNELVLLYNSNAIVYGGRGVPADLKTSVTNQIAYLNAAVKIIDETISKKGTKTIDFKMLTQKFQVQFPKFELPYMIEYGAYGLVQSETKRLNVK